MSDRLANLLFLPVSEVFTELAGMYPDEAEPAKKVEELVATLNDSALALYLDGGFAELDLPRTRSRYTNVTLTAALMDMAYYESPCFLLTSVVFARPGLTRWIARCLNIFVAGRRTLDYVKLFTKYPVFTDLETVWKTSLIELTSQDALEEFCLAYARSLGFIGSLEELAGGGSNVAEVLAKMAVGVIPVTPYLASVSRCRLRPSPSPANPPVLTRNLTVEDYYNPAWRHEVPLNKIPITVALELRLRPTEIANQLRLRSRIPNFNSVVDIPYADRIAPLLYKGQNNLSFNDALHLCRYGTPRVPTTPEVTVPFRATDFAEYGLVPLVYEYEGQVNIRLGVNEPRIRRARILRERSSPEALTEAEYTSHNKVLGSTELTQRIGYPLVPSYTEWMDRLHTDAGFFVRVPEVNTIYYGTRASATALTPKDFGKLALRGKVPFGKLLLSASDEIYNDIYSQSWLKSQQTLEAQGKGFTLRLRGKFVPRSEWQELRLILLQYRSLFRSPEWTEIANNVGFILVQAAFETIARLGEFGRGFLLALRKLSRVLVEYTSLPGKPSLNARFSLPVANYLVRYLRSLPMEERQVLMDLPCIHDSHPQPETVGMALRKMRSSPPRFTSTTLRETADIYLALLDSKKEAAK